MVELATYQLPIPKPRLGARNNKYSWRLTALFCVVVPFCPADLVLAQIVSYEATSSFPDEEGWTRTWDCTPERWLKNGFLVQHTDPGECGPPPAGDRESYRRFIPELDGSPTFFVEWRMEAEGDRSEFPWAGPALLSAWNRAGILYWFAIARDQVKFVRDGFVEILFVDIEPGVHTHRLEVYSDQLYLWYIDGELIHSNVPGGPYPAFTPAVSWRAKSAYLPATVHWDYIRFGTIPAEGSGDYDSDGDVDLRDFYFFDECLANGGPDVEAGPGCVWADMDQDNDVDFHDFALFQLAFTGS